MVPYVVWMADFALPNIFYTQGVLRKFWNEVTNAGMRIGMGDEKGTRRHSRVGGRDCNSGYSTSVELSQIPRKELK